MQQTLDSELSSKKKKACTTTLGWLAESLSCFAGGRDQLTYTAPTARALVTLGDSLV